MWERIDGTVRFLIVPGISYLLGALALLVVILTVDLSPDVFNGLLMLCVLLGLLGPFMLWLVRKEVFMKIGIVERIRERRRIAAAAALAERYRDIDLMSSPEAVALPIPFYRCSGCNSTWNTTADKMYWVDEQPLLPGGWYCEECVDKLDDKPRDERLNMEIFLVMLDSDLGAD